MMGILRCVLGLVLLAGLISCGGEHDDLNAYVQEVKRRPAGSIAPLPAFRPYESFIYSAAALRSPFDIPVDVEQREFVRSNSNIKPDEAREREFLESFDLEALTMVGTLQKGGTLWALLKDGQGNIQWVTNGNYIGKNHGKIVATNETKIELIEIVSDGLDGWVERPRVLALSEKE